MSKDNSDYKKSMQKPVPAGNNALLKELPTKVSVVQSGSAKQPLSKKKKNQ